MKRSALLAVTALLALVLIEAGWGILAGAGMPGPARVSLAIMLFAAILWVTEAVPLFVTSIAVLALSLTWLNGAMAEAGLDASRSRFTAPFFSDIILLFLGGFVLSSAMHRYGLDERIARWVIARAGGSIARLLLAIILVTVVLSMWISNTATAAMMISLCLPLVGRLPAGHPSRKALILAVPLAANVGGMGTPIGSPPNAIVIQYLDRVGEAPSFLRWMVMAAPLVIVLALVIWVALLVIYRGDGTPVTIEAPSEPPPPRSPRAVFVAIVALVTALGWLTGGQHGLSSGTVALLPVLVFFGGGFLEVKDLRALSWDVLLLMGGGLCLGEGIAASGLAEWLVAHLPTAGLSAAMLGIMLGVAACLMSTLMSNTATANLVTPIVMGMVGVDLPPLMLAVALSCSMAMSLPVSTPPNAIAFSSGEVEANDLLRVGSLMAVVGLALLFIAGRWWWGVVGIL